MAIKYNDKTGRMDPARWCYDCGEITNDGPNGECSVCHKHGDREVEAKGK